MDWPAAVTAVVAEVLTTVIEGLLLIGISSLLVASGAWFGYVATGSDDQISFSWTDPSSPSDDTFYYELNGDSGNTVTGVESSVATAYVDSS